MFALWQAVQRALGDGRGTMTDVTDGGSDTFASAGRRRSPTERGATRAREAAVFERIEAFRRRRPRLRDEVVTLAHGAGGKASAALLDAVFLPGLRPTTSSVATTGPASPTPPCSPSPSGERLAFSTDSFVVKPLRFPGGSVGHAGRARHHQRPGHDGRPARRPLGRLRARGGLRPSRSSGRSWPTWPRPPPRPACRSSPATPRWSTAGRGRRHVHHHRRRRRSSPTGRDLSARVASGRATSSSASGTIGDHGTAVMLARGRPRPRGRHRVRHARRSHGLVERPPRRRPGDPLAARRRPGAASARSATSSPATPTLTVVLDEAACPCARQVAAACELLGIDPALRRERGQARRRRAARRGRRRARRPAGAPLGGDAARIGEIRAEPPGIVVLRTAVGGTRIVDMLVGDPLPRIC